MVTKFNIYNLGNATPTTNKESSRNFRNPLTAALEFKTKSDEGVRVGYLIILLVLSISLDLSYEDISKKVISDFEYKNGWKCKYPFFVP